MLSERCRHLLAVFQTDARYRHQELHRHVRGNLAFAHLLLNGLRQQLDQRQPPRHPAHAAVETARQILQLIAEALLHFGQQPALFQRGLVFGQAQRAVQQQSLGFVHGPDHGFHRVPAQLLERRDALVAVNDQVAVRLVCDGHDHDGRLLPRGGQRGQQTPLAHRMAYPEMLPAPVELVKLQSHGPRFGFRISMEQAGTGLLRRPGEVGRQPSWNQGDAHGSGLSRSAPGVCP